MKQDYEIAREELGALFESLNFSARIRSKGKHIDPDGWAHTQWEVTITRNEIGKPAPSARLEWRAGLGCKGHPDPAEVLARVCDEYHGAQCSFEEWADNYGYDTDSRKAERIFNACKAGGEKLASLGLTGAQIAQFAELSCRL